MKLERKVTGLGHILGLRLGILGVKENVWIKEIGGIDNVTANVLVDVVIR